MLDQPGAATPAACGRVQAPAGDPAALPAVAIFVDRYPRLSETFVRNEVRELARVGHRVCIEAGRPGDFPAPELPCSHLTDDLKRTRGGDLIWLVSRHPLRCLRDLGARRRWRAEEATRSLRQLAPCARRVARFRADHVHAHFAAGAALDAQRIATLLGLTHSVTGHGYDVFQSPANLREKLERASFAMTTSEFFVRHMQAIAPAARVELMALGVDAVAFRRSSPLPGGRTIVTVGRLVEKKGLEYLIRAAALLDDVDVRIVGDGGLRAELEQLARDLRVEDRITFLGARRDIRRQLEAGDVFALPCVIARDGDSDSTPVVIKEAIAMELMVVVTDVAGVAEAVKPPWGEVVAPRDSVGLAEALDRLLAHPPERRAELGRQARLWVLENASLKRETAKVSAQITAAVAGR